MVRGKAFLAEGEGDTVCNCLFVFDDQDCLFAHARQYSASIATPEKEKPAHERAFQVSCDETGITAV
jgi:hypothetical protein